MKFIDLFAGIGGFHYGLVKLNGEKNGGSKEIKTNGDSKRYTELKEVDSKGGQLSKHDNGSSTRQEPFTCVYSNEWDKYAAAIYRKHFGECDETDIRKVAAESIPDHDLICAGFPCQSFSIAGKRGGFKDTRGTLFFEIARIARTKRTPYLLLENVKGLLSHDSGNTFATIISTLDELGYDLQWQVLNSKNFGVPQNRERVFIIGYLRGTPRPKVFPVGENSEADIVLPTLTARYWGGQANGGYIGNKQAQIRRLTPIECERLQGFPDNWTEGISDTQRYKCLGNAVTTNVVSYLGKKLLG